MRRTGRVEDLHPVRPRVEGLPGGAGGEFDGEILARVQATPATILVSPNGFDWTDAGIGAAMALGLILLGSGMLLVARRHRRPMAVI